MTTYSLKLIGCVTMLIDHIAAQFFIGNSILYVIGRGIGRIAFPIFAFLIIEGLLHTRDLKRYILRLAVFVVLSEFPFDFFLFGVQTDLYFNSQNVFFTLLLGLLAAALIDYIRYHASKPSIYQIGSVLMILVFCLLAEVLQTDYSSLGVLLILIFYFFWRKPIPILMGMLFWVSLFYSMGSKMQLAAVVALIPIFLYKGEKGKSIKYLFYLFYPIHLLVIGAFAYFFKVL